MAKNNRRVQNLSATIGCLSRYLQVQPLKAKYAKETADVFKKMIKI